MAPRGGKGSNALKALPANLGVQGRKIYNALQNKAAQDASKKRLDFEKEQALAEKRLVETKRKQASAADKRGKKKPKKAAAPKGIQSTVDELYWGANAGEEEPIPQLNTEEGPFAEGGANGPHLEDELGSGREDGALDDDEHGSSSGEEERLQTVQRRGPRDPPAPPAQVPATISRSQAGSNRMQLALSKILLAHYLRFRVWMEGFGSPTLHSSWKENAS